MSWATLVFRIWTAVNQNNNNNNSNNNSNNNDNSIASGEENRFHDYYRNDLNTAHTQINHDSAFTRLD